MAYNKEKLFEQAKKVAKKKGSVFMVDVIAGLAISSSTFYEHFPKGSNEYGVIEDILAKKKSAIKLSLRKKFEASDNPSAWKYLYLLLGDKEERHALHGSQVENTNTHEFKGRAFQIEVLPAGGSALESPKTENDNNT